MKIICTDDLHLESTTKTRLTKGKIYDVIFTGYWSYYIINDEGKGETFIKERFIDLSDNREEKLNQLLNI